MKKIIGQKEFRKNTNWEKVVDFTKIRKVGVPVSDILKLLRKLQAK